MTLITALPCVTQRLLCSQYLRGTRQLLRPFTAINMCCLLYFITPVVKRNSNCFCLLHYADVEKRRVTCGCALYSFCIENKDNITRCKKCASRTEKLTFYIAIQVPRIATAFQAFSLASHVSSISSWPSTRMGKSVLPQLLLVHCYKSSCGC